ncbi:MAG TPA: VOC family protein [Gaiellaceae bacterium]|nr:VOC family protein [Gaiellaceae bacterium]
MPQTKTRISKLGVVIIPVKDQESAYAFYTDVLGFEKRTEADMGNGYKWLEVAPEGAETTIAIVLPGPDGEAGGRQTGISLFTDDIEATHADLKDKGVDVDAEISRMGDPVPPMFWFRDPEGNSLLIVEPQR